MKRIITLFIFLALYKSFYGCDIQQLDSLFNYHIQSMEIAATDIPSRSYTNSDFDFLATIIFLHNFDFQMITSYGFQFMITKKDINNIQIWYKENRKRLNCEKVFGILYYTRKYNNIATTFDPEKETLDDFFDEIDCKLDSLYKLDTFIRLESLEQVKDAKKEKKRDTFPR